MARTFRFVGTAAVSLALLLACTGGPSTSTSSASSSSSSGASGTSGSGGGTSGSSGGTSGSSGGTSGSSGGTGSACHAQKDCTSAGDLCIGGDVPAGCGGVNIHECDVDGDCQKDGGTKVCSKGDCSGQNRCVDPQCSGATDTSCPTNQVCNGHLCVAKPCSADGECSGFCVNGVCTTALGACGKQLAFP